LSYEPKPLISQGRRPSRSILARQTLQNMSVFFSARRLTLEVTRCSFRTFSTTPRWRADPWPLPHTPQHLSNTQTPSDIPPPTPIPRSGESIGTMRARLVYQSRKRGTLESDLLLSTFARDHLGSMDEAELKEYDKVFLLL